MKTNNEPFRNLLIVIILGSLFFGCRNDGGGALPGVSFELSDSARKEFAFEGVSFKYSGLLKKSESYMRYFGKRNDTIFSINEYYLGKGCYSIVPFGVIPGEVGDSVVLKYTDSGCGNIPALFFDRPIIITSIRQSVSQLRIIHEVCMINNFEILPDEKYIQPCTVFDFQYEISEGLISMEKTIYGDSLVSLPWN